MIYLLFGEDTYQSDQKLKEIIGRYLEIHKSGLNLKIYDLSEQKHENFFTDFFFLPVFKEKKLFILKNAFSNKTFQEEFLKNIEKFSQNKNIVIFYEKGKIKEDVFLKAIKKYGKIQEFNFLSDFQLENWIRKKVESFGGKIDNSASKALIDFVGNDLWRMENEIKKLVAFKKGKIISRKDVEEIVIPKLETDIFKTIDQIASKNKRRSLEMIKKHLAKGEDFFYIFSLIKYQFRNLLVIKDLMMRKKNFFEIKKYLNLHPFVIKKLITLAEKLSFEELKKIYKSIFQADLLLKTSRREGEILLELFITQI